MLVQFKVLVFVIVSIGLIWLSWPSLRRYQSHGFFRFFAWEAILLLILINLDAWFYQPLSLHQIISWFCLLVSIFLVIHGVQLLHLVGQPDSERNSDPALIGFEKTTQLVMVGAASGCCAMAPRA